MRADQFDEEVEIDESDSVPGDYVTLKQIGNMPSYGNPEIDFLGVITELSQCRPVHVV